MRKEEKRKVNQSVTEQLRILFLFMILFVYTAVTVRAEGTSMYQTENKIEGHTYAVIKCEDDTRYTFLYAEMDTNSEKVMKLRKHNEVIVKGQFYQDETMWGYATYCGCTGWVQMKFLKAIENGVREDWQAGTYFVSVKEMNLREKPSESAESLAKLHYGDEYYVQNIENGWGEICENNVTGFVYMSCLMESSRNGIYVVNTDTDYGIHFRSTADGDSDNIIGTVPNNTEFYINSFSKGWGYAEYNGQSGWVHLSDLYRKNTKNN